MSNELTAHINRIRDFKPHITTMLATLTEASESLDKVGLQKNCAAHFGMWQACKECQYAKKCSWVFEILINIVDADINIGQEVLI